MFSKVNVEDALYLGYLRIACEQALEYANAPNADFRDHTPTYMRVRQKIGVIGEMLKSIPRTMRVRYDNVGWDAIELRHEDWERRNFQIDSEELRRLCSKEIPVLLAALRTACAEVEG